MNDSSALNGPDPPSRRRCDRDLHDMAVEIHDIDRRVIVLEMRASEQDHRLTSIESDVKTIHGSVNEVLDQLMQHIVQEQIMQNKLMIGVIATLLSALSALAAVVGKHFLFNQ